MYRIHDFHILAARDGAQCRADVLESRPKLSRRCAVTTISRFEGSLETASLPAAQFSRGQTVAHVQHRVDSGIARDMNGLAARCFLRIRLRRAPSVAAK